MTTIPNTTRQATVIEIPAVGATGPTVTQYQQLANDFLRTFDTLIGVIPKLEPRHPSTVDFVRGHLGVPLPFMTSAVAMVEQHTELTAVAKLDPTAARDSLQYLEAMQPVADRVKAFLSMLQFTLDSTYANLASNSLQAYSFAKTIALDPDSGMMAEHVASLRLALGRHRPRVRAVSPAPVSPAPVTPAKP